MNKSLLVLALTLLAGCIGQTGSGVKYASNPSAVCPAPVAIAPNVTQWFEQYPEADLQKTFYRHFVKQQNQIIAFQQKKSENCPAAFWVQDNVAETYRNLPEGHPMREFFKTYVAQQRALDAYYAPMNLGGR